VPALHAAFEAFNRWLDDDWGFDRGDGRLYAAPMMALSDPEQAAAEATRVIEAGARILVTVPGPVPDGDGYVSPGHPKFDPFWAVLNEAGVPMAFHAGLSGTNQYGKYWGTGEARGQFEGFKHSTFPLVAFADLGISQTFAALICHGVFERFPNLRVASIENGAMWVPDLVRHLTDGYGKMPMVFDRHPVEQFKEHVWVAPYYEDDMGMLKDVIGVDRLLFGSDFPHAEGLPEPTDFVKDIPGFTDDEIRAVMRDNVLDLITAKPA
jgi:predicted TIM-barrel fold metal-dependent hydrolase